MTVRLPSSSWRWRQVTLRSLEAWITEQSQKKSTRNDIKYQPRPPEAQSASAASSPRQGHGNPASRVRPQQVQQQVQQMQQVQQVQQVQQMQQMQQVQQMRMRQVN